MAATVKPIEAKAVHRIQAGQVIVDLCSVAKELVENSLDAGATVLEIRFKNNGLDEIEVQDNGSGIAPANYESVALKHHTSKLSTYDDLESLSTFGFRGEALSSLCALSNFSITTALEDEAPRGHRLDFESSGKLKSTTLVACQRGTTATVAGLFENLPVRRKELSKNVKKEYGRVLGLLHAYACISTNVKFIVKNSMSKGKSTTVFATQSNQTTRDNIANIYGARTLSALASLHLDLDLNLDSTSNALTTRNERDSTGAVLVRGHISKPVFGEGRPTPDRQMFFVNGRPCGLPQIAKAINEVYKSFNVSQSPFIFADFQMDTNAYDVNVSPDKRSIFLHNASSLIDSLKAELTTMFDNHEHTLPQSQLQAPKTPAFRQLSLQSKDSAAFRTQDLTLEASFEHHDQSAEHTPEQCIATGRKVSRELPNANMDAVVSFPRRISDTNTVQDIATPGIQQENETCEQQHDVNEEQDEFVSSARQQVVEPLGEPRDIAESTEQDQGRHQRGLTWNSRDNAKLSALDEPAIPAIRPSPRQSGDSIVQNAFDRMRPKRLMPEVATVTIGDRVFTRVIGSAGMSGSSNHVDAASPSNRRRTKQVPNANAQAFSQRLEQFSASGTRSEIGDVDEGGGNHNEYGSEQSDISGQAQEDEQEISGSDAESQLDLVDTQADSLRQSKSVVEDGDRQEEAERVAELIRAAEESQQLNYDESKRATKVLRGWRSKDSTVNLQTAVPCDLSELDNQARIVKATEVTWLTSHNDLADDEAPQENDDEERLSLTVSKSDFAHMNIVGQFNLGFILAVRRRSRGSGRSQKPHDHRDELFIIDQHASDEKFNFERLQAETVVGNQRMVRSVTLDLTAVEEEILIASGDVLEKNGFIVDVDVSGDRPVGQRCQLVSLPLSKEVAFGTGDLDELIHLLSETPMLSDSRSIPRPSKVRKMFAMRACRSSIMIGKPLSRRQMTSVVQHMGTIDKPWNCPHGRPTMRHLASLDTLDRNLWQDGHPVLLGHDIARSVTSGPTTAEVWTRFATESP